MQQAQFILAIDQGTSSTKTLIVDKDGMVMAKGSEPLTTMYLKNGFVEQDANVIFENVLTSVKKCTEEFVQKGYTLSNIASIGISNQRETFVVWDKMGKPLHNAIVWQCKRSVSICEKYKQNGTDKLVAEKTGLVMDPYFSATKLVWLVEKNGVVKQAMDNNELFFGTIDTWLLYKLTNGEVYATDHTNASRTMLFNLHTLEWDASLLQLFGLEGLQLPKVQASSSHFGTTDCKAVFSNQIPVNCLMGDSQAAAFGEACFTVGMAKATLGTGCSVLMNIGNKPLLSQNGMVTTVCWSTENRIDYAYEGVIVTCGATIEWLKNELALFQKSEETEAMAMAVLDNGGVYLIPAFSGLGSPYWDSNRKASIHGMQFGTTKNHIVRAALESIPYQIKDTIQAMEKDAAVPLRKLQVDGGMASNGFVIKFLANLLQKEVTVMQVNDVSALGVAFAAGLHIGLYENLETIQQFTADAKVQLPQANTLEAESYKGWQKYIEQKN